MDNILIKRQQNQKKFLNWDEQPGGGRKYWYEIIGRAKWKARYIKEVNEMEITIRFYQEIYNENGKLVEIHQKYPSDLGHQRIDEVKTNGNKT